MHSKVQEEGPLARISEVFGNIAATPWRCRVSKRRMHFHQHHNAAVYGHSLNEQQHAHTAYRLTSVKDLH